jgi:hypothetical protein
MCLYFLDSHLFRLPLVTALNTHNSTVKKWCNTWRPVAAKSTGQIVKRENHDRCMNLLCKSIYLLRNAS